MIFHIGPDAPPEESLGIFKFFPRSANQMLCRQRRQHQSRHLPITLLHINGNFVRHAQIVLN